MPRRVLALLRARLSGDNRGTDLPIAPLVMHGLVAAVLCGLVRGELPPFAYGLVALSITGALVAIPLVGELGYLLRADPAREWVAAQPVSAFDLGAARTIHLLLVLWWLACGSLVPAAALAGAEVGLADRLALVAGGLGLVTVIGAALLLLHALFTDRADGLLVAIQTVLVVGVVVGFVVGIGFVPRLAPYTDFAVEGGAWMWLFPPAWFAAPLGAPGPAGLALPAVAGILALLVLMLTPPPRVARRSSSETMLARLLTPVRLLATRFWVRRDERAIFDLVFDALPREREVVIRTYPMVGIPLAFLVASVVSDPGAGREDLLAVLLFTACIYLPILLIHVPASESHAASWIYACAPVRASAIASAAVKAVAARFLVPLYVLLALLAWFQAGPGLVLRLALPGYLLSLLVTRTVYARMVESPPLSIPPDEVRAVFDWAGAFAGMGIGLTVAAVLANRLLPTVASGLALALVLLALELLSERRLARGPA